MSVLVATPCRTGLEIVAHRGCPSAGAAPNSLAALQAALETGHGLETDIRDLGRKIVIAHDPASEPSVGLDELLKVYRELQSDACLALNIKSCGLAEPLSALLNDYQISNYFVFDMAVPDARSYARAGVRFFTRQSELERQPALYEAAAGVWLDAFYGEWYDEQTIQGHLNAGKDVCVVSPELHRRDPAGVWAMLSNVRPSETARLLVCTDHSQQIASSAYAAD
jgi:glycerophosphoryl diester phosphodiesterase